MTSRENAWLRHQQSRWMRPDAARWIRPDAARFLKPGTDLVSAFPALERKYNPNQPRVPAGNPDGGQWTDGDGGGSSPATNGNAQEGRTANPAANPMGNIDFGDLPSFSELFSLFRITPRERDNTGHTQLAGEVPEGDSPGTSENQGPSPDPPEIPKKMPETRDERMNFVRTAAEWIRVARQFSRYVPLVDSFLGAVDQVSEIKRLAAMIKTANDPPRTLDELQERIRTSAGPGYEKHHIAEESAARDAGIPESLIQSRDNLALVPILKHIEISRYYSTKEYQPDGTKISPRDQLKGMDFESRRQFGLDVLRRFGVLK